MNARSPIELFERIHHLPHAVLLDACNTGENSHFTKRSSEKKSSDINEAKVTFTIMSHSPVITVQFKNGLTSLTNISKTMVVAKGTDKHADKSDKENDGTYERYNQQTQSIFQYLSDLQKQLVQQVKGIPETTLPFLCGWMGAFGYDLNIHTDAIDNMGAEEYELPDVSVGFYANSIIFDHAEKQFFWVSLENEQPDWLGAFYQNPPPQGDFQLSTPWRSNLTEQEYTTNIARIKQYLTDGDCYQVNFAQRFIANYAGSEFGAYKRLREANQAPFSAYLKVDESVIMSVSPERFLSVTNGEVETKPIKGTISRHKDTDIDVQLANELRHSEKDRAENLMIVDLLRNDLSKHCRPFSVSVPKLFELESYPAVHHLVSTVIGQLKENASTFDLLGGAFPGGSITGCPKVRAMQIISELEPNKRSIYCGSIGYIGIRDDMDINICIRTVLAENGLLFCWAGGGIVIDSDAALEYQETQDKVAKILPVLEQTLRQEKSTNKRFRVETQDQQSRLTSLRHNNFQHND
ncbi:MAG: aminodeoxychorismate synthase component I [Pseudomonadota bacterium]